MKNNKLVKNYIYNTLYQILVLLSPLITTPYISRVLGATGIGIYSYAQSIATYFVLVGAVGTTLYGQREIAYVQNNLKKRTEIFWEITIFRFIAVVICTIVYYFIFAFRGQFPQVFQILTLEVFATAFDISWFFMGIENFKLTVIRNTIIKLVGIILVFILVKSPDDVPLYTLCLTLPIFLGNISLWFNLKKYLVRLEHSVLHGIPKHIKPVLILFLPQIATEVYTVLDKTMIGVLGTGMDQVGFYTNAQKIIKIILMIVTSLGTVMLPAMSVAFSQGKNTEIIKSIKMAFNFIFMIAFAMMYGIIGISERFVPVFLGEGFDLVGTLMIVISPIIVIIGISNVIGRQFLLPTNQQAKYTISIMTGACVNFFLNIILIHLFNAIGASIATVIAEAAVTFVQIWYVRNQLPLKECFKPMVRYFLYGLIMAVIIWLLNKVLPQEAWSLGIMIFVGALVYILELIIAKDEMLQIGLKVLKSPNL